MPPTIGEIRLFAGTFAPAGWMLCDGAPLPISENDALFTVLGTRYGGDGQETFNLPDLRGRVPVHQGSGYIQGENGGVEAVTLTTNQMPGHAHPMLGSSGAATAKSPAGALFGTTQGDVFTTSFTPLAMSPQAIGPVGGSQPHDNMQPYTGINYIISLFGFFPTP